MTFVFLSFLSRNPSQTREPAALPAQRTGARIPTDPARSHCRDVALGGCPTHADKQQKVYLKVCLDDDLDACVFVFLAGLLY